MAFLKNNVAYWNCGGGLKSKFDYLKGILVEKNISIMFISESEIAINDLNILKIPGYDLITANTLGQNTKSRHCCYVHVTIRYRQVEIKEELDMVALDIENSRLIGLYKPFKLPANTNRVSFFHSIIKCLNDLSRTNRTLIIGGDFNVDLGKKSSNLDLLQNWSTEFGLEQLVKNFTWRRVVLDEIQQSAIDHIYTNDPKIVINHLQSVSDHDIITVSKEFPKITRSKVVLRDWRPYTSERLNEEIAKETEKISNSEILNTYEGLSKVLNNVLELLAPKRTIRIRECQIVSQKLEKVKKRQDRLFKKYRKTGSNDVELLKQIKKLNKDIRACVKDETSRTFQIKAKSKDP
jgi:exonuclease III